MPVLAAAAIVFAISTLGLALLVEPVPTWYYHLAWWSYIVAADDLNRRLSGRSLLRDRPAHFAGLAGVSVLWWTLFELANLRLGNWYYVMSLPWTPLRWAAGVIAFASVLPGIVETLELVENLGLLRSLPGDQARGRTRTERKRPRLSTRASVSTIPGSTLANATTPAAHRRGVQGRLIT